MMHAPGILISDYAIWQYGLRILRGGIRQLDDIYLAKIDVEIPEIVCFAR